MRNLCSGASFNPDHWCNKLRGLPAAENLEPFFALGGLIVIALIGYYATRRFL